MSTVGREIDKVRRVIAQSWSVAWIVAGVAVAGCVDDGGPRLSRVTPDRAGIGASVEIVGDRFCGSAADCTDVAAKLEIGIDSPIVQAPIASYTATSATFVVPTIASPGETDIVLTVNGRSSNALPFVVLVP